VERGLAGAGAVLEGGPCVVPGARRRGSGRGSVRDGSVRDIHCNAPKSTGGEVRDTHCIEAKSTGIPMIRGRSAGTKLGDKLWDTHLPRADAGAPFPRRPPCVTGPGLHRGPVPPRIRPCSGTPKDL